MNLNKHAFFSIQKTSSIKITACWKYLTHIYVYNYTRTKTYRSVFIHLNYIERMRMYLWSVCTFCIHSHAMWEVCDLDVCCCLCDVFRALINSLVCRFYIGWFSEAGLHEQMPFVIFRTRSHERSRLSLLGRFLSMRWFTLCITMDVSARIAKQYKCNHCCICKNYRGKVMGDGRKCLYIVLG